jgi:hypothetical protein
MITLKIVSLFSATYNNSVVVDEESLYFQSEALIEFLTLWSSDKATFFERVYQLSQDMAMYHFWGEKDALLTLAFLQDLLSVGYKPPLMNSFVNLTTTINTSVTIVNEQKPYVLAGTHTDIVVLIRSEKPSTSKFDNILVVINFNTKPRMESVKFLRKILPYVFPHFVFYGQGLFSFTMDLLC